MKKSLLIAMVVLFAISANAQLRKRLTSDKVKGSNKITREAKITADPVITVPNGLLNQRRNFSGANQTQSLDQVQLCTIGNFSSVREANSRQVWYDQNLNTVTFIHRPNIAETFDVTSNNFRFDISTDGGANWLINQGPVFQDDNFNYIARYPEGVIANPTVGTNTANAYEAYDGYSYAASTGNYIKGRLYGIGKLDGSSTTQHEDTLFPYVCWPVNMFTSKNGDIWKLGTMSAPGDVNNPDFHVLDTVIVSHGVWNSTSMDYDWTHKSLYVPCDTLNLSWPIDMNIVFNDAGTVGYIVMITNNDPDLTVFADQIFYLSVLKTTDGGQNWDFSNQGTTNFRPDIINFNTPGVDALLLHDTTAIYGTTFDADAVMDFNDNLHILTGISVSGAYSISSSSIDSAWALFDVSTQDQGAHWQAQLIARPRAFRGSFGTNATTAATDPTNSQDNRPFASRSWDGHKLFFSWFETDTLYYPSATTNNNNNPDLFTVAYDVDNNRYTDSLNLTRGTDAFGQCAYASGAYYAIDSAGLGTVFSLPVVYAKPENDAQTSSPFDCYYLHNANVNMSLATIVPNPVTLPSAPDAVTQINNPHSFKISSNYPNPFHGKTSFDITLVKASDVTVEVSNVLGAVLSFNKYSNLDSGLHTIQIDGSKFAAGVYTYKVKVGNDVVTKKMIVQ